MNFKDKIIWITGASSGTGEALVYAFNKQKAKLIISARRKEKLEKVKKNCTYKPDEILVLPLDLEEHGLLQEKADIVFEKFGKIDILFNNGGISQRSLVKDTVIEVDKKIMNVNYFGSVILTKAVLPSMIKNKSGHIVVMSSLTGKFSTHLRSAYAASKHALHGFFDALRFEVYKENINVTIICAGFIRTNISFNALTQDGNPQKFSDPKTESGMSPNVFAKKALKAIYKKKEEVLFGGKEIIVVYLKRFTPFLFSKIIRKLNVK